MSSLDVKGAVLSFECSGENGPWVTLINGHTRTQKDFRLLARFLTRSGFRVLCFDNRGAGETVEDSPFDCFDMRDDVLALWRHLGVSSSHLVGFSMGGVLAQLLACHVPEKLASLVLVSTTSHSEVLSRRREPWGNTMGEVLSKLNLYFAPAFVERNELLVKSMSKNIFDSIQQSRFSERSANQVQAFRSMPETISLDGLRMPILVLHGDLDAVIPLRESPSLPDSSGLGRVENIPGVGHLLLAECPQILQEKILEFIKQ